MPASYLSGQLCPLGGHYGQFRDADGAYAGHAFDHYVQKGQPFPAALAGHHFRYGGLNQVLPHAPAAGRYTAWDPANPVTAG